MISSKEEWRRWSQFLLTLYWVTLLMKLLASVPQNTLYLTGCDRILVILSMVVDEFFYPWSFPWLYSKPLRTLKPFLRHLWTPSPPCQKSWVWQWNNILEIIGLQNLFFTYISIIYHFFEQSHWTKNVQHQILHTPIFFNQVEELILLVHHSQG